MENPFQVDEVPKTPEPVPQKHLELPAEAPTLPQATVRVQVQEQPSPPSTPSSEPKPESFWAYFDAQIEQAHDELNVFRAGSDHDASAPANAGEKGPAQETQEQPAQTEEGMWKYLVIAAGALLALALAAPFIRKLLGREDDDSGWYRRGSSLPHAPDEGSGGSAVVPEPSENTNSIVVKPKVQDLAAMALGIR